jgi:hypothetical protein
MEQLEQKIIEKGFSELLSTKHLYQSITLDLKPAIESDAQTTHEAHSATLHLSGVRHIPGRELSLPEITERLVKAANYHHWYFGDDKSVRSKVQLSFPPVRTLCSRCDDVEAFNLFGEQPLQVISVGGDGHEVFSFTVQCQRCKTCIIVFLVKRTGPKIQLVGRSEFEEVQVPKFIPKHLSRFYSQAVIAFQCGQVLAGLFLLRTLIEQHMRAVTKSETLRGEDLCEEYAKQLGQDVSGGLPSFKEIYSELSNALHTVDDRGELFESQHKRISLHFEGVDLAWRLKAAKKNK